MRKFRAICLPLAAAVATMGFIVAAQAAEAGAERGLPQLNPDYFPQQLVWLAISFALLYWLMSRVALPRVSGLLEERQVRISQDLETAQRLRDDANAILRDYEAGIEAARAKAQQLLGDASTDMVSTTTARQAEFQADIAARIRAAEDRIEAAKAEAMTHVRSVAVELAVDIADRIGGLSVTPPTAAAAVDGALDETLKAKRA